MNNYEWLLNMGGEERQAWFDAEHADVERKCPGYEPENHRCRYHDTDFELTRENVCKLKREVAELQAENEKLKADVIQYAKDCGECGTAMPKGVSWPRFSDGSLLRYGDIFLDGAGNPHECHCVEFIDPKTAGLGASTIIHGNRYGIGGEYDGVSYNLFKGETLERPTDERDEGLA